MVRLLQEQSKCIRLQDERLLRTVAVHVRSGLHGRISRLRAFSAAAIQSVRQVAFSDSPSNPFGGTTDSRHSATSADAVTVSNSLFNPLSFPAAVARITVSAACAD